MTRPPPMNSLDTKGTDDLIARPEWLLIKRGYYYRPNSQGYTGFKKEAGLYSEAEAHAHVGHGDGISMVRFDAATEFSPEYRPTVREQSLLTKVEVLQRERDEARALFDECAGARDTSGYLGTVPDCIEHWSKTAETLTAEVETLKRHLSFVARWCWRDTDSDRLNVIKWHPVIKAAAEKDGYPLTTADDPYARAAALETALRGMFCPRPANSRPDDFDVGPCNDAGECGCLARSALSNGSTE